MTPARDKVLYQFATAAGLTPCQSHDCIFGFRGGQTVGLCHCDRDILRMGPCGETSAWFSRVRRLLRAMSAEIAAARRRVDSEEVCESGLPDCGEVCRYDSEGVPLCARCYEELKQEQAP